MSQASILVVEDEEDLLDLIRYNLSREGYHVVCARTGEAALSALRTHTFDAVILDLMLPGVDGLEVCRRIKSAPETAPIPVVMVTARTSEADMVCGLDIGADDYVCKPFSPRVLMARVKAVLRRRHANGTMKFGALHIDPVQHSVRVHGQEVNLTATEFRILTLLTRRPGWVFTRERIVDATRETGTDVTGRSVDVHIVALRRKLGPCGAYIETVRGVGYRFRDPGDE